MMLHRAISLILGLIILTGCMYPSDNLSKNQLTNDAQLQTVQIAIDQYVEANGGILPIYTKESNTPLYQKYVIDFSLLKNQNLIQDIPGTAFENGGHYQYILTDVERQPTVKVIDLRIADEIRSLQQRLNIYRNENTYPPFGEQIADQIYSLDYEALNLEAPPHISSPYSDSKLPVYIDTNGKLLIDYRIDLYRELQNKEHNYRKGDDIRPILTEDFPVVPAYSIPFTVEDNEPIFAPNIEEGW